MIHRITIPAWRPARDNELMSRHWRTKHKLKSFDAEIVAVYAKRENIPPALGKRRVSLEITLACRQKKADPLAYAKSLLDALVRCHMLIDDSAQFVVWGGVTYSRGDSPSTAIVLDDLDD